MKAPESNSAIKPGAAPIVGVQRWDGPGWGEGRPSDDESCGNARAVCGFLHPPTTRSFLLFACLPATVPAPPGHTPARACCFRASRTRYKHAPTKIARACVDAPRQPYYAHSSHSTRLALRFMVILGHIPHTPTPRNYPRNSTTQPPSLLTRPSPSS